MDYYTKHIMSNDNWEFAGIYAGEGISGTQVKKRAPFLKMIKDCEKGKIDMIEENKEQLKPARSASN